MILEGNTRGYGAELARHLLNPRDCLAPGIWAGNLRFL